LWLFKRVNDIFHTTLHDIFYAVPVFAQPMVSDAVLKDVVSPDLF
jgi:hypothetical protein